MASAGSGLGECVRGLQLISKQLKEKYETCLIDLSKIKKTLIDFSSMKKDLSTVGLRYEGALKDLHREEQSLLKASSKGGSNNQDDKKASQLIERMRLCRQHLSSASASASRSASAVVRGEGGVKQKQKQPSDTSSSSSHNDQSQSTSSNNNSTPTPHSPRQSPSPSPSLSAPALSTAADITLECGVNLSNCKGEIDLTAQSLGQVIKWPLLLKKTPPEKFLERPPVRFLFDLFVFCAVNSPALFPSSILNADWAVVSASKQVLYSEHFK